MKIPLTFKWTSLQGDTTQFLQKSIELEPIDLCVVIELEVTPEYFFHSKEIKKYNENKTIAEVTGGDRVKKVDALSPIMLTPAGVA